MARTLLIIDDDKASCLLITRIFGAEGIEVTAAHDGRAGIERARSHPPDVVLLDLRLPGVDGLEVLARLKQELPALPVVMLTAHQDIKTAVRATQLGAFDYLTKPFHNEEIVVVVRRALQTRALELEVEDLRRQLGEGGGLALQMGPSPEVRALVEQVRTVAETGYTVLVIGETGSGKELVAQAIHRESERRAKPFVAIDCGAIPEQLLESELFGHEKGAFTGAARKKRGQFQIAQGGTLFLDEVGNLPLNLQAKLLRVLESRQVQAVGADKSAALDLRFVAATNNDLQVRASEGHFRSDLYFRLAQYTISLPALKARPLDIPYLAHRLLAEASVELRRPVQQIVPSALELLEAHPWPGNVRELRNVIRQAVLMTKDLMIGKDMVRTLLGKPAAAKAGATGATRPVPGEQRAGPSLREVAAEAAEAAERRVISETLRATRGNKSQAARELDTDFKTLHLKMKRFGIRGRDFLS
jgi:DNA-binding NtrC family response regulator